MSRRARGQSMVEMAIIVALIGIATIGLVGLFGDNLRAVFGASSDSLAGNTNSQSNADRGYHRTNKNLCTFGMNASHGAAITRGRSCG